jgi:zinc transporter ZupT
LKDIEVTETQPVSEEKKQSNGATAVAHNHHHEFHHHNHDTIKPSGYLSLFADGLHNFTDGLALGAAFSASTASGIATALAVFFHEVKFYLVALFL